MVEGAVTFLPLRGLPDFEPGDDLAQAIVGVVGQIGGLETGDVVVAAHKVVSKCEGALVHLRDVDPSPEALAIAGDRDPRLVEVVLRESSAIVRRRGSFLVTETPHGFVCAGSGVDVSNTTDDDTVVLLPQDPDRSAGGLRERLEEQSGRRLAVVVTDSFGRAWRRGSVDVAVGISGLTAIQDLRGTLDHRGRPLRMSLIAIADEVAAAAELVMRKARRVPVVVARGLDDLLGEGRGSDLVRARELDLFR